VHKTADDYSHLKSTLQPAAEKLPKAVDNLNAALVSTKRLTDEIGNPDGTVMRTVNRVGNDLQVAADSVQSTTTIVNQETLPQINGLARESRQAVRSIDRAASQFNDSQAACCSVDHRPRLARASRVSRLPDPQGPIFDGNSTEIHHDHRLRSPIHRAGPADRTVGLQRAVLAAAFDRL
jgi:hypothetical protein